MLNVFLGSATVLIIVVTLVVILAGIKFFVDFKERAAKNRRVRKTMDRIESEQTKKQKEELLRKVEEKRKEIKD